MAVFTILSESHRTKSSLQALFRFLSDFKNFHAILPEEKVDNFQFTDSECSFNIKGITPMKVKKIGEEPSRFLLFSSEGLGKFNFRLNVTFEGEAALPGVCFVEMTADLNPFIKTLAEKPLTVLVNTMSLRLSHLELPAA